MTNRPFPWDAPRLLNLREARVLCSEAITVNQNHRGGQAATLHCKRWSCPICLPRNRKRVVRIAARGDPTKFLTLTATRDHGSKDECAVAMVAAFRKLIKIIRATHPGKAIEYLRVFEAHPSSGWPHMHVLMRAPYLDIWWLRRTWETLIGAFMVDIRAVKTRSGAAFYCAKYIGKEVARFKGVTRWFRSANYSAAKKEREGRLNFGTRWNQIDVHPKHYFWKLRFQLQHDGMVIDEWDVGYCRWIRPMERDP